MRGQGTGGGQGQGEVPTCEFTISVSASGVATMNMIVPLSAWCKNEVDWGDGCVNDNTSNPISHQYTKCGSFTIKHTVFDAITCEALNTCTQVVQVNMPAVFANLVVLGDVSTCGSFRKLRATFSIANNCLPANENVNITGEVPANFLIMGGNYAINGNIVTTTLTATEINAGNASRELWVMAKWCTPPQPTSISFTVSTSGMPVGSTSNPNYCTPIATPSLGFSNTLKWNVIPSPRCPDRSILVAGCQRIACKALSVQNGDVISWDFGDNYTAQGTQINHFYAQPGTYTVRCTISNNCAPLLQSQQRIITQTVEVTPCGTLMPCPCANGINIDGVIKVSELGLPKEFSLSDYNDCLAINGELIVDEDFFIIGNGQSEIRMQPNASVEVNRKLTFIGLNIHGCQQTWAGINVQPYGKIETIFNRIADAENALIIQNSEFPCFAPCEYTQANIYGNLFEKNYTAISLPGPFIGGQVTQNWPFWNNTIDGQGPLLPLYSNGSPKPTIGVEAILTYFTIGTNNDIGISNRFKNLNFGVSTFGTIVDVYHAEFENMGDLNSENFDGSGIYSILTFGAEEIIDGCRFKNCNNAIWLKNGACKVLNNVTENVNKGIFAWLSDVQARDNSINFKNFGLEANTPLTKVDLRFNVFNKIQEPALYMPAAIEIDIATGETVLEENEINIPDFCDGINLFKTSNGYLFSNKVTFTGPTSLTSSGIWMLNSNENQLKENNIIEIVPEGEGAGTTHGMAVSRSTDNLFCCNTTSGSIIGALFSGTCLGTDFRHNEFAQHANALFCASTTRISPQEDKYNIFNPGSGGAIHDGMPDDRLESRFEVYDEDLDPNTYQGVPWWPEIPPTQDFFGISTTPLNTQFNCGADPACNLVLPPGINETDLNTARNVFDTPEYGPALPWESDLYLYKRIRSGLVPLGIDPDIDAFYASAQAIGKHHETDSLLTHLFNVPTVIGEEIKALRDSLALNKAAIAQKHLELSSATNRADSTSIFWEAEAIRIAATPFQISLRQKYEHLDTLYRTRALEASLKVALLPDITAPMANRKLVLGIWLDRFLKDSFALTLAQFGPISLLAHQCPDIAGDAVYWARALYLRNEKTIFQDDSICGWSLPRYKQPSTKTAKPTDVPSFSPNPAQNELFVSLKTEADNAQIGLRFVSATGQVIQESQVAGANGRFVVSLSGLAPGLYFCSVLSEGKIYPAQKVIIRR